MEIQRKETMANRVIVFDTETAGLPVSRCGKTFRDVDNWPYPVQLAWICFKMPHAGYPGRILPGMSGSVLIKPDGWEIGKGAIGIHGITNEKAHKDGIPLKEALSMFYKDVEKCDFTIAHNMEFDLNVIASSGIRVGFSDSSQPILKKPMLCTMLAGTSICKLPFKNGSAGYKWPKLSEMYMHFFGHEFEGRLHDAKEDCRATIEIFEKLIVEYKNKIKYHCPVMYYTLEV
jgi:DNA polymerase III epsilon subunit-like protein